MNKTASTSIFVAFVAAAAGCSSGKSMTEDDFCKEYAKRECAKPAEICGFAAATCEPVRVSACHTMAAASKTGARTFKADRASKCLDQVTAAYANLPITAAKFQALDLACARVFSGGAKAMEACTIDFDCDGDLICDKQHCATKRVVGAGAGCSNLGEVCPAGQYCTKAGDFYACTAKQASGQTCGETQPCVEDLRCSSTCVARAENISVCTSDDDCKSGYCDTYVPAGQAHKCSPGLSFAPGSASCDAFMDPNASAGGSPDAATSD